jgi:hypothetical protein
VTLKYLERASGEQVPVLTHCPACGHHWPENYEGDTQRWKHLSEHDPEDFGLSAIGETSPAATKPLFDDPRTAVPEGGPA